MKPVSLWYVVIRRKDGTEFFASPLRLTTKEQARELRDELRECREKFDARTRRFGLMVPTVPPEIVGGKPRKP